MKNRILISLLKKISQKKNIAIENLAQFTTSLNLFKTN